MEPNLILWGKTDRRPNASPSNYHPLLFHLFDVAFSAAELWRRLPSTIKSRMAAAIGVDVQRAGTVFVLLAGLHDLGKAYPNFQNKAPQFLSNLQEAGFDFPDNTGIHPHNFVSVPEAERLFAADGLFAAPLSTEISRLFAYTLGAHHGVFPQSADLTSIMGRTLGQNTQWQESRDWLANQLKAALPDTEGIAMPAALTTVADRAFAPLLAALISVADWFGSSKYFQMRGAQAIEAYRTVSRTSAVNALDRSGWTAPLDSPAAAPFAQLFAYLSRDANARPIEANPLQSKTVELQNDTDGPALWMIEEEMGAGKTEAAFSIFDDCRVKGLAHGVYIAMPTQATSNAMFERLGDFLRYRHPTEDINLILAHSHATLDPDYVKRMEIAETFDGAVYANGADEEEGSLLVRSWFTQNKQTLLAHYGVGTIDQALLGVLQTRHWFVRLFGLAGKVVIFDEVHAYDAYMSTLLVRLIEWLAELDCTVVLLSATLPMATRLSLADAYAKGAKARLQAPDNCAPYPRITLVGKGDPNSARAVPIVKEPKPVPKAVSLLHCPNTPEAVKAALLDAIPGDGCAIVICNTVANAQRMYQALKDELQPLGWHCLLFHARTPFTWRKDKEDAVLREFDKTSGENRSRSRPKTLLVATQVVEQSLDLDADFMASEIAPVDLILQRMGRLYRHARTRSTSGPQFALLYDTEPETGLPDFGMSEYVYARYILLRSWHALKTKTVITLPDDIEPLVTAVYDSSDPTDLSEEWAASFAVAKTEMDDKRRDQRKHAKSVSVRLQEDDASFGDWLYAMQPTLLDDDDPQIHNALRALTRDGDPSVTVVLCGTGEAGILLAPEPPGPITPTVAQQMMQFSVPISQKTIYHALKSELPPPNWKQNAHLKHCRQIVFENGVATIANRRLTLTKEKGLEIESGQD